jgi:DNA primase
MFWVRKTGNSISFISEIKKISYPNAIKFISETYNIKIPEELKISVDKESYLEDSGV